MTVTVGPRQAIAVHTGACSLETSPKAIQQVSILFSVNVKTTLGQVSTVLGFFGLLEAISCFQMTGSN